MIIQPERPSFFYGCQYGRSTLPGVCRVKSVISFGILHFLFTFHCVLAQSPDWIWAKSISGYYPNQGGISNYAISTDKDNNIYTAGFFYGTIDFDPGQNEFNIQATGNWPEPDIFVSKLDSLGNFLWAKAMGGFGSDWAYSMMVDPQRGDVYITGAFSGTADFDPSGGSFSLTSNGLGDVFVVKLTGAGNLVWARSIGGSYHDGGFAIEFFSDRGSGICFTGYFRGTVDFDPGPDSFDLSSQGGADVFVAKWDTSGQFVWAKAIGGMTDDSPGDLEVDAVTGAIYTVGSFVSSIDLDPGSGVYIIDPIGTTDIFIDKLDEDGDFLWASSFGGEGGQTLNGKITIDSMQRDIYIGGSFTQVVDFDPGPDSFFIEPIGYSPGFVCRLNSDGHLIWVKAFQGYDWNGAFCWALSVDPLTGDVYTTGGFDMLVDFDPGPDTFYLSSSDYENWDVFVCKLDRDGNFVWAYATGGLNTDFGTAVTINKNRVPYITGLFLSAMLYFDPFELNGPTYWSSFIAVPEASPPPCAPIVTSVADSGAGSLREIIGCALTGDTILFQLPPASQITLTSGEIIVKKNLCMAGPGINTLTISGNNNSRIFNLLAGRNLTLEKLALKDATAVTSGGSILTNGNLTLDQVLLENNFQNAIPKALTLISPGNLTISGNVEIKQ